MYTISSADTHSGYDIVCPTYDIVEPLITTSYTIFYTVSAHRISYAITYYDIIDSELRYHSAEIAMIGYRMDMKSYTMCMISYVQKYDILGPP